MTWQVIAATLLAIAGQHTFTVPTPRLYQDANVIVTLRPAMDLDLNYVGVSLMIRQTPTKKAP